MGSHKMKIPLPQDRQSMCSCKNLHIDMMGVLIIVPLRDNTLNLLKEKSKQITQGQGQSWAAFHEPISITLWKGELEQQRTLRVQNRIRRPRDSNW